MSSPVALTVKVVSVPVATDWLFGSCVISGGPTEWKNMKSSNKMLEVGITKKKTTYKLKDWLPVKPFPSSQLDSLRDTCSDLCHFSLCA